MHAVSGHATTSTRAAVRVRADNSTRAPRREAREPKLAQHALAFAASALMMPSLTTIAMDGAFPRVAFAADTTFCVTKCAKECSRIAPGSASYCAETCADECDAMASDGDDISETSSKSIFATKKESTGFEGVLVGIVDKSAVFFAPNGTLGKDPACDD